jgi:hypothetical protein
MSSLQQNWRKGQNRFCLEAGGREGGEMAPTMCAHMNKLILKNERKTKGKNFNLSAAFSADISLKNYLNPHKIDITTRMKKPQEFCDFWT